MMAGREMGVAAVGCEGGGGGGGGGEGGKRGLGVRLHACCIFGQFTILSGSSYFCEKSKHLANGHTHSTVKQNLIMI